MPDVISVGIIGFAIGWAIAMLFAQADVFRQIQTLEANHVHPEHPIPYRA